MPSTRRSMRRQWGEALKAVITFVVLAVGGNLIG